MESGGGGDEMAACFESVESSTWRGRGRRWGSGALISLSLPYAPGVTAQPLSPTPPPPPPSYVLPSPAKNHPGILLVLLLRDLLPFSNSTCSIAHLSLALTSICFFSHTRQCQLSIFNCLRAKVILRCSKLFYFSPSLSVFCARTLDDDLWDATNNSTLYLDLPGRKLYQSQQNSIRPQTSHLNGATPQNYDEILEDEVPSDETQQVMAVSGKFDTDYDPGQHKNVTSDISRYLARMSATPRAKMFDPEDKDGIVSVRCTESSEEIIGAPSEVVTKLHDKIVRYLPKRKRFLQMEIANEVAEASEKLLNKPKEHDDSYECPGNINMYEKREEKFVNNKCPGTLDILTKTIKPCFQAPTLREIALGRRIKRIYSQEQQREHTYYDRDFIDETEAPFDKCCSREVSRKNIYYRK
ncbi:uncharacterized protein [Prorops nasuta]|uniref:uncharacterized protein n=1 Tax=Prorops nasuta TaxID=863751 RepID=UPI0034CDC621